MSVFSGEWLSCTTHRVSPLLCPCDDNVALLPAYPVFCSSVCVDSNTRIQKSVDNNTRKRKSALPLPCIIVNAN